AQAISAKMIRRHPHVFGDEQARSAGSAKGMWEKIKAEEKTAKREARLSRGLPPEDAYPTAQRARIREDLAQLSERILPPDGVTPITVSRT
ncbi:MAG: hypothetical protein V4630_09085, partial [Pseudomonadota bacterium]